MKKALILHGWEGNSENHWFPWLWKKLEEKWFEVHTPDLSHSEYPVIEEQLADLGSINLQSGDVIVWHSLWCQLALKLVEEKKLEWITLIFVAPSYNNLADELGEKALWDAFYKLASYYNTFNDFRNINKLGNTFTIFLSDDDPYIDQFSAKEYYREWENVEFISCTGKGHFNSDAWVMELPEVLEHIE
jgi:predicted alpha/beta hydrolase family esterase